MRHFLFRPSKFLLRIFVTLAITMTPYPACCQYWYKVNLDGFGQAASADGTRLIVFDSHLFAYNEDGLFQFEEALCKNWKKVFTPAPTNAASITPMDNFLYQCTPSGDIWFIAAGMDFDASNWKQVSSSGSLAGSQMVFHTIFEGRIYAHQATANSESFEMWRSSDIGQNSMTWEKVVANGFGDPVNNKNLRFIQVFNDRLLAGTTLTRSQVFGSPQGYLDGIEIWESTTGHLGSWSQVNEDGFGTETFDTFNPGVMFRTNNDAGGTAVYQGMGQSQEYFYVGTLAHFGAEVWRYDGTGLGGWTNVTPFGGGPNSNSSTALRYQSMAVYQGRLYVAEGYPSGNLLSYDGNNWTVEVQGPNPFDPDNGGLESLSVFDGKVFVTTLHLPYSGVTQGDQVWGFSYPYQQDFVCADLEWINPSPQISTLNKRFFEFLEVLKNTGGSGAEVDYTIEAVLDGETIYSEPGPLLEPEEEYEVSFSFFAEEGSHDLEIRLVSNNPGFEEDSENRVSTSTFFVPNGVLQASFDFNQDGFIDARDLLAISLFWQEEL